jgi:hypothetical protein
MRRFLFACLLVSLLASLSSAQFSFYLIDNFESGNFNTSKWWNFGTLKTEVAKNASPESRDLIAESCGDYSLNLVGSTDNWYVGGIGTDLGLDATNFSRFQVDIYGSKEYKGKLVVELFDDDNHNYTIEQDSKNNYEPIYDDKWIIEIPILGEGFTRVSIPFTAFKDVNPGVGDDIWNPSQENGSGGLLKLQLVAISEKQSGKEDFRIDNLLLTY